ncbi:uncharacterized protein H6S33_001701 [Morchella sextelata]|uniref:uncharacterized protein n=1 Tax=Morchella sextelata TaxID=1174677 RepID=UPI001D0388B9|nr:uncharacterized protein H6S33_001701 [Morchella sextelata]KAH0608567.1 hypothetical protein H6S33_001701 [Morchella sextelata]
MAYDPGKQNIGYNPPNPMPYHGGEGSNQQWQQPPPQNYYGGPPQQQQQFQLPQGQLKYAPNESSPSVQPPMNQPYGEPPPYTFEEKFAIQRPRYNDLWAAILFITDLLGLLALSIISFRSYSENKRVQNGGGIGVRGNEQSDFGLSNNTIVLFILVCGVSLLLSYGYFLAARAWTKQIIYATAILNIIVGIGTAAYYFSRQRYGAAIVFIIFALFYAYCFWTWRNRIPFAVLMFETSFDVAKQYGHVYMVSSLGGLAGVIFAAWMLVTYVAIYATYTPSESDNLACGAGRTGNVTCSNGKMIGLVVFATFSGYWISEVIKNIIHVSISGVYGSWYFCSRSAQGMPAHPTLGAFKRAMTYSFGSISFGSLVVAIIQLLKHLCRLSQNQQSQDGCSVGCVACCILGCLLDFIESAVRWFNHYAYSYIALYGKAYIDSAKETYRMMKDRGLDALVNDCLVDPVLSTASVFVAMLCTLIAYVYLYATAPVYNSTGSFTPAIMAFAFLVGLQICNIFLTPIKSGVATIFTSMAHNPEILLRDFPELYHKMLAVYPHLAQAIHA